MIKVKQKTENNIYLSKRQEKNKKPLSLTEKKLYFGSLFDKALTWDSIPVITTTKIEPTTSYNRL